jgi:tetratricopeptide (TPR) repeat protein
MRLRGFAALRADDPAAAVVSFRAALAHGAIGGGAEAAGEGEELAEALLRARVLAGDAGAPLAEAAGRAESDPTPAHRLDYALLLLAAKRNADARLELAALASRPDAAATANRLLALLDFDAGDVDAAAARFAELLAGGRDVEESFYYLGLIAERHADYERALRLYARIESGENLLPAMLRAATILDTHGEAPAAEQLLARLAEDQPEHAPEILSANARFSADAGDLPEALRLLDLAIDRYPDDVELRFTRASWYDEAGQVDASLRELRRILESRPADPAALNALGYTLADHSLKLGRARALIERAHAAAPNNAAIRDSMGWVLYREGRTAEALPFLAGAYQDEHGAEIAAHLGEVLWRLGRRDEAERTWSQADALDPGNRLLQATRSRLHAGR